jgi:hypothetical protein
MSQVNRLISAATIAATLALGLVAKPAMAQQNRQRGLVNVAVFEVIDDITVVVENVNVGVGVAANIAANVCGTTVPVAVLAEQVVVGGGELTCMNDAGDTGVTISQ